MATLVAVMLDGVCDNDTTTSNEKKPDEGNAKAP